MKKVVLSLIILCSLFMVNAQFEEYTVTTDKNNKNKLHPAEPEMVKVKGGKFKESNDSSISNMVVIFQPMKLRKYKISKYPVTQKQWEAIMGDNPSQYKGENLPVETVNFSDIQKFISQLNDVTGKYYRLPTDAEWEYAARGGKKSKGYVYSGSNNLDEVAWYKGNSKNTTHPVGTKAPNELGIYDMSGNVFEWCENWSVNYLGYRAARGGCFLCEAYTCRIAHKFGFILQRYRFSYYGFRLVLPSLTATHRKDKNKLHPAEPEMILVKGGTFTMGCTEDKCDEWELPAHQVTLNSFKMAKYPVTQGQWDAIMGTSTSQHNGKVDPNRIYDNYPRCHVNWEEVQEFILRLNTITGKNYRLPTEAEWEYAARGGKKSKGYKYSGSNNIDEVAWYAGNSSNKPQPVGTKKPNELGIYDMCGNVWEWCSDWCTFSEIDWMYPDRRREELVKDCKYTDSPQINPQGAKSGDSHVVRGGCWQCGEHYCRVAHRDKGEHTFRRFLQGFRLVLSVE